MTASRRLINVFLVFILTVKYVEAAKYTFIVVTGTEMFAGTNANVKIKLHGTSRKTGQASSTDSIKLSKKVLSSSTNKDPKDPFERGQTDTFMNLKDDEDLVNINKIEVKRLKTRSLSPDWLLDKITVITERGETFVFGANIWLKKKEFYYPVTSLISVTGQSSTSSISSSSSTVSQPQVTLPPVVNPVVTSSKVKYTVTIKTGTKWNAGTNANINIRIYGIDRNTGKPSTTSTLRFRDKSNKLFERGQTNAFTAEDNLDLVNLNKIEVMKSDSSRPGPDWYLEQVSVATQDGLKFEFPANRWLRRDNQFVEINVFNPLIPVTPAPVTPAPVTPAPVTPAPVTPAPLAPVTPAPPAPLTSAPPAPVTPAPPVPVTPAPVTPAPVAPPQSGVLYNVIVYTGSVVKTGSRARVYLTLYGALRTSSEIHLRSPTLATGFQSSRSKVFQVTIPDVGAISSIRIRPDVAAKSPYWEIQKVFIISQLETVYEFIVFEWLRISGVVKYLTALYPTTSMRFISYPPCVNPLESKIHPDPSSLLVLLNDCSKLSTIFKLRPDGVIQHLVSGMCFQGSKTSSPRDTAHGDQLKLNFPCTLYRPGYDTSYALQFKFTPGGSLMEKKSRKCISTNKGQLNTPLTFSNICDTDDTKIQFIDKSNNVVFPEKVGKSPSKSPLTPPPPSPPTGSSPPNVPSPPTLPPITPGTLAPAPPGTPRTENVPSVTDTGSFGGNRWPIFCPASCSASSCASSCQPTCCGGLQQPANVPASYPVVHCPTYCSPGHCRSECPVGCCFPNLVLWGNQKYDENKDENDDDDR